MLIIYNVVENLILEIHVVILQITSKNYAKVRAARAAQLFFVIQPMR